MKQKLLDIIGFSLFVGFFIVILPILMVSGAVARPIRFVKHVSSKVNNKEIKEYYY